MASAPINEVNDMEVGFVVHHYQAGRTGTVMEKHDGDKLTIQFDKFNCAGKLDAMCEKRSKFAFIVGLPPNSRRANGLE